MATFDKNLMIFANGSASEYKAIKKLSVLEWLTMQEVINGRQNNT